MYIYINDTLIKECKHSFPRIGVLLNGKTGTFILILQNASKLYCTISQFFKVIFWLGGILHHEYFQFLYRKSLTDISLFSFR